VQGRAEAGLRAGDPRAPRGAVRSYLDACRAGDYAAAAQHLALDPSLERGADPALLARRLKIVLDRTLWVQLERLSASPEGDVGDGLPEGVDLVGRIDADGGSVDVLVERVGDAEDRAVWKFAGTTVAQVPELYERFGYGRLGELLPAPFFEIHLFEVQLWQWIGLLALVLVVALVAWIAAWIAQRTLRPLLARTRTTFDDHVFALALGPARLVIAVLLFSAGALALELAVPAQRFLNGAQKAVGVLACTWLALRLIDALAGTVRQRLAHQRVGAVGLVPLVRRVAKVAALVVAVIVVLQNLGFNVTGIVAGLGVGGLAIALGAQKSFEHLFGGATILADQPVRVGDFCRFGDRLGTVEDIGLRSTRIRTLDRTVVTVPNAEFSSSQIENFTRRDKIRLYARLGLRYETTPDQMRWILAEVKRLLAAHPMVDPDPARIRFVGFGDYALDLELFAFVPTTDFNEFLAVQEDVLLRLMDVVAASGSGFAFPSQTLYLGRDQGPDETRTRDAEAVVRGWREAGTLPFPAPPEQRLREIAHTLDYPPRGSAVAGAGS
jgi:MscS family membrane protein